MFERQDLPAVTQRILREQPDFRKAVEHDPGRFHLLDDFEDPARGLAQLEVGRIEQALLLRLVEQAFRRDQREDGDRLIQCPAVRGGAFAKLFLGFGERDVEACFADARALAQEVGCDRGLAGARIALDQIDAAAFQPAAQDVVEAIDPERGLRVRFTHFDLQ